jgi:hypothetical protein
MLKKLTQSEIDKLVAELDKEVSDALGKGEGKSTDKPSVLNKLLNIARVKKTQTEAGE